MNRKKFRLFIRNLALAKNSPRSSEIYRDDNLSRLKIVLFQSILIPYSSHDKSRFYNTLSQGFSLFFIISIGSSDKLMNVHF